MHLFIQSFIQVWTTLENMLQAAEPRRAALQRMMNQLRRRGGALYCWGLTLTQKKMEWSLESCRASEQSPASVLMTVPCSGGMLTQEPLKSCQSWHASTWPPQQPLYLLRLFSLAGLKEKGSLAPRKCEQAGLSQRLAEEEEIRSMRSA